MINATSPAAKSSPINTDAIKAMDTRTSALISKAVTSPITASRTIGIPQKMIAIHAASKGSGSRSKILISKAIPEMAKNRISRFIPPHSSNSSSFFISILPLLHSASGRLSPETDYRLIIPIGVWVVKI